MTSLYPAVPAFPNALWITKNLILRLKRLAGRLADVPDANNKRKILLFCPV